MPRRALMASLVSLICSWAPGDQILQTSSASLTTYRPSSATPVQDVRPLVVQRGVGLDGSLRAGAAFGWALQANPLESGAAGGSFQGITLASGAYAPFEVDLAFSAEVPWVVGRTFNALQETSGSSHRDSDGYQGKNWFQVSQPEIVLYDADSDSETKEVEDLVYLVYGADRYVEFQRTDDDEDTFRGVNGAAGVFEHESGSPDLWVYYDQVGNRTYFFGGNTSSEQADWQLWKFVDPAGNTAYVGDATTASAAVSNGYNSDGTIKQTFDSAGRRYCYAYSTIDSVTRLAEVIAETDAGGGWGDCGTETMVGKVEYEYYQTGDNTYGDNGNLQLVSITTPLSTSSNELVQRKYYRYWTGTYHATNNPDHPDTIKLVLGFEGCRGHDWDQDESIEEAPEFLTTSEDSLKPYSEAYFKYDSSYRVISVFFNGECGCTGGLNGEHALTYEANPSFSGSAGYDTTWFSRVVIEPPTGGAWITQYLDEVGQPISRVQSDIDPASTGTTPEIWVTQVVRNSDGQVTEVHTPANISTYTHDTSGSPDGSITTNGTAGLVWYLERLSSGDTNGFVQGQRQKEGSTSLATNSTYVSWTSYTTRDLNIATGVNVTRPLAGAERVFHTATTNSTDTSKYDETSRSYTWWETSTTTDVLYVTLKKVTTTAPAVSTGKNGSGSATSTSQYLRKDGTVAFH